MPEETIDRSQEKAALVNRLAQALNEHLEDETKAAEVAEALVKRGIRDKTVIERVTKHSYSEGRKVAESELVPKLAALEEEVKGFKNTNLETASSQPEAHAQDVAGSPNAPTDKAFMALAKKHEALEKQNHELLSKFETLQNTVTSERRELKKRETEARAMSLISDSGFEEADTVLSILRSRVSLGIGVEDGSGEDVIVLKPGTTEPIHGEGTYTTLQDFLAEWAETPAGKRFRKVPDTARKDSQITGNADRPPETAGGGLMSLRDDVLLNALRQKRDLI